MRIECPDCAATYDVPEDQLSRQRMVRCSRCGGEWVAGHAPEPTGVEPRLRERASPAVEAHTLERVAPDPPIRPVEVPPPPPRPPEPRKEPELTRAQEPRREPELLRAHEPRRETVAPPATERLAKPVMPPRGGGAFIAWMISIVVIVLLCWGAFTWRAPIMRAWPPSARAYAALGLAEPAR